MLTLHTFISGPLQNNCYLVSSGATAAIIDPAPDSFTQADAYATAQGITIAIVIITHSHWDHIAEASLFQRHGALIMIHQADAPNIRSPGADHLPCALTIPSVEPDHFLQDNERIAIGNEFLQVIYTPGHSPGSICLYDAAGKRLFSGDTLFHRSMGAITFPTSQPAQMWSSLKRLAQLPADTMVYPGHGPTTTIGKEYWLDMAEKYFGSKGS